MSTMKEIVTGMATSLVTLASGVAARKGFIPIPISSVRETDATNEVGLLTHATTPKLDLANGDTNSELVITWAAADVTPVMFQTPLPPDLDDTAAIEVHFRAKEGVATDHPVVSADTYFNEGDTKISDDSAAVTGTSYAEYTITISADDIDAGAQTMSCELTPGTHSTSNNTLIISAIWIEYTCVIA